MTIREFQAWLAGLQENMGNVPTAAQWARVVEEVDKLEERWVPPPAPEPIYPTIGWAEPPNFGGNASAASTAPRRNDGESVSRPSDAIQQALRESGRDILEQAGADALEGRWPYDLSESAYLAWKERQHK